MPDARLARTREGYEGYVYQPVKPKQTLMFSKSAFEVFLNDPSSMPLEGFVRIADCPDFVVRNMK